MLKTIELSGGKKSTSILWKCAHLDEILCKYFYTDRAFNLISKIIFNIIINIYRYFLSRIQTGDFNAENL